MYPTPHELISFSVIHMHTFIWSQWENGKYTVCPYEPMINTV